MLTKKYTVQQHIETFEMMAKEIAPYIDRCIFSFVEMYKKLEKNMPEIIPLTDEDKNILAKSLGEISAKYGMHIQTCRTNKEFSKYGINISGCITTDIIGNANKTEFKDLKHKGMREGCHCIESRDIGAYDTCMNGCKYCYASFMKRFTNHSEPWGDFLDIKYWEEIKNPQKYAGKEIFLGSVTDPYLPAEAKYMRTRKLLEELQGSGIKLSIQTKSDLILRDIDLIKTFSDVRVGFSINTLDEDFRKDMDKAVSIKKRILAMKKLHEEGIKTTCFISPIFPGRIDIKAIIEEVKDYCNWIWLENLNLRGDYKKVILDYIKEKYPNLMPLYNEIYLKKNNSYWEKLDDEIKKYAEKKGLEYVHNNDNIKKSFGDLPTIVNFFYHEKIKKSATLKNKILT